MSTYLLSLAALHAEHPDAPPSVFGPDGDFEGAPNWHPPLWDGAWAYHIGDVPDPLDGLALDLRIPSVAARLAGLCARALGHKSGTARACFVGTHYSLIVVDEAGCTSTASWCLDGRSLSATRPSLSLDEEAPDSLAFLAALTLALAPRIAALRSTP